MSYLDSIRAVNIAQAQYDVTCELCCTEAEIAAALAVLHRAKAAHRALHGAPRRVAGEWV